jgi:APA family basic amino acid/polyamine antiporter
MPEPNPPTLVRAIGRWSLAALTINCVIASGIFGLPSVISAQVGNASPFAWILAAMATGLVMACFAEVSSRFEQSGGVYLYARTAFGRTTGIAIAWLGWLGRLTAGAANANLFVIYLAEFWPGAKNPGPRLLVLTVLLGVLTSVNYIGVRRGTIQSNLFTAAKLITLFAFIVAGLAFLLLTRHPLVSSIPHGPPSKWLNPMLLLMFAYGGYETALMPGGEAKDPRRDYPFALFVALITCTIVYTLTQLVIVSVLPQAFATDRPMAAAAQLIVGGWGATFVSIGVLLSTYGYLSANILGFPRILLAMAEQGDMPAAMARVHPRFRTPHVAILVFAVLLYGFSIAGSFGWNLFLSAVSRLIYYASVCAALPVLRRKLTVPREQFHLPMGDLFAVLAVGVSLLLFPKLDRGGLLVMGVLVACIFANSVWAARRARTANGVVKAETISERM